jgi:hypothetical protein
MPRPERAPLVGELVHFYERRTPGRIFGPLAALVTLVEQWPVNEAGEVNLAVLGEAALRFVPLVPYDDAGATTGQWWTWPRIVDHVEQSGL